MCVIFERIITGLADALHLELLFYNIDVHNYFPAAVYTPGFDEENKTKPEVVRDVLLALDDSTKRSPLFSALPPTSVFVHDDLHHRSQDHRKTSTSKMPCS